MHRIELQVGSVDDALHVRRFVVREEMSALSRVVVEVTSRNDDIDLETMVGMPSELRITHRTSDAVYNVRRFSGVCSRVKQVQAEETGLSTYVVDIEPALWLLTQRRNYRIFQHLSVPEIASALLDEWQIKHSLRIDRKRHPKLELRVQYGESDHAFLSRLLEEAGIAHFFLDEEERGSAVVLHDEAQLAEPREGGPIPFVDNPSEVADRDYLMKVSLVREIRPGRLAIRDHDFRRSPELSLHAEASDGSASEHRLEQYHYMPGAFAVELGGPGGSVGDDRATARHDERAGKALATRGLEALRSSRRTAAFTTSALDLSPGVVFSIAHHPRSDFDEGRRLLVTRRVIEGSVDREWVISGEAVFTDCPYRPAKGTPKPVVHGVQSALVVGPEGESIHTDEFGRVRVQFQWDREGERDDHSSCWIRVSQSWAGAGYGMIALPRVGHEVLVGFLGGNPDQPVVVGRLYNGTSPVPYKLPEAKTVSGWRTASTPGTEGFNELRFDDAKGQELVHMQAERNLTKLVKVDESEVTGLTRTIRVGQRLVLTTGGASIVLDGGRISIEADELVDVRSKMGDVVVVGDRRVKINPGPPRRKPTERERERIRRAAERARRKLKGYCIEPFWPGINLRGSEEFRAKARDALFAIGKTRMGRALLRKMARTSHSTMVVEAAGGCGGCKPDSVVDANRQANGKPGKGCGSTVLFNPAFEAKDRPKEVVLGHSMARALQNATGTREGGEEDGRRNADAKVIGVAPYSIRGCTENSLRRNMKLPLRQQY